jgi:hypothetical protein
MTYKLYYLDWFSGRKLLFCEYKTRAQLLEAWLSPDNRQFRLEATEEKEIKNLPNRNWQSPGEHSS